MEDGHGTSLAGYYGTGKHRLEEDEETSPSKRLKPASQDATTHVQHNTTSFVAEHSYGSFTSSSEDELGATASSVPAVLHMGYATEPKKPDVQYSNIANKLMAKMGYKEGTGLGRHGQGRVNIVEASKQRGRRGLGLDLRGFESADVEWNFEKEEVSSDETVEWIPPCTSDVPSLEEMQDWIVVGKKKLSLDGEDEFCSPEILKDILQCKSVFDNLESEEMRRARTRCNPYETIRGAIFQNRAAMKMANMDAVLDFMFTNPKTPEGKPVVGHNELLYFADMCAGPGGFSEYVLWRKKWDAKGFGFTLKGPCDFKLEEFLAAPAEFFEPHYGVGGRDGDGDIYRPDNQDAFRKFVHESTDGKGVHFAMADGGFSVEGQENIQEILSKRLYLCQFLCALSILRPGGHFVCKLFDLFTKFSVGLVFLMYKAFHQVAIFKPVTSRPANSERYIVCKGMRADASAIHDYMRHINRRLDRYGVMSTEDITEVVPLDIIKSDDEFDQYLIDSNEKLGFRQAIALAKIRAFVRNTDLYEKRQAKMREECLQKWKIPDEVRMAHSKPDKEETFKELLKDADRKSFSSKVVTLTPDNLDTVKSVYDYRCYVSGGEHCFIMGMGRSYVFQWDGQPKSVWRKVENLNLELPRDTLLEAEKVIELRGEGKAQRKVTALHVIDAMVLNGVDIRSLHFNDRLEKVAKFVKAIHRPTRSDLAPIRVKDIHRFETIEKVFDRLDMKFVKGSGGVPRLCYCGEAGQHFLPTGIHFIKTVKDPWMMAVSRSRGCKYFFHTINKESRFDLPKDSISSFMDCLSKRLSWIWGEGVKIHPAQRLEDPKKLSRTQILDFVSKKTGKMIVH